MSTMDKSRIIKAELIKSIALHPDGTSSLRFPNSEDVITTKPYWQERHYRGHKNHHGWYVMLDDGSEWWSQLSPLPLTAEPASTPELRNPFDVHAEMAVDHHLKVISALIGVSKNLPQSRELSLYLTKLQEAQMWLNKHIES